jgi:hypothetical protein
MMCACDINVFNYIYIYIYIQRERVFCLYQRSVYNLSLSLIIIGITLRSDPKMTDFITRRVKNI